MTSNIFSEGGGETGAKPPELRRSLELPGRMEGVALNGSSSILGRRNTPGINERITRPGEYSPKKEEGGDARREMQFLKKKSQEVHLRKKRAVSQQGGWSQV